MPEARLELKPALGYRELLRPRRQASSKGLYCAFWGQQAARSGLPPELRTCSTCRPNTEWNESTPPSGLAKASGASSKRVRPARRPPGLRGSGKDTRRPAEPSGRGLEDPIAISRGRLGFKFRRHSFFSYERAVSNEPYTLDLNLVYPTMNPAVGPSSNLAKVWTQSPTPKPSTLNPKRI